MIPPSENHPASASWRLHHTPWEREFLARFPLVESTLRVACPFIKLRSLRLILESLPRMGSGRVSIKLLTRLNVQDCRNRVHDLEALELLYSNPLSDRCDIDTRIHNALHAKCYIFDEREVIITSSNLSFAAFNRNLEVGIALCDATVIARATAWFDGVFATGKRLTVEAISGVRVSLGDSPPSVPSLAPLSQRSTGIPPGIDDFVGDHDDENADENSPVDPTAAEVIDKHLADQLEQQLHQHALCVSTLGTTLHTGDVENAFLENVASRFTGVFGPPQPRGEDLAAIFFHGSIAGSLGSTSLDSNRAAELATIGKLAMPLIVAEDLCRSPRRPVRAGDLTRKVNYVTASDHAVRKFHELGLMRVLLSPSIGASTSAAERAHTLLLKILVSRIVGYLVQSRDWATVSSSIASILELADSFPFESYATQNYKSELQRYAQQAGLGQPEYTVIDRQGPEHDPVFVVEVRLGKKNLGRGRGTPIKSAEVLAAHDALVKVRLGAPRYEGAAAPQITKESVNLCAAEGLESLRKIASRDVPLQLAIYALLPSGSPRSEHADKREELAVLGSLARALCAYLKCIQKVANSAEATLLVSQVNRKEIIIERVLSSPLGAWLRRIAQIHQFREALSPRIVVESINACFGVLFSAGGLEACAGLSSFLFNRAEGQPEKEQRPSKSRLLIALQAAFRNDTPMRLKWECKPLHTKSMSHEPCFEVKIVVDGVVVGRGTGSSKKAAEETAATEALANETLKAVLSQGQQG